MENFALIAIVENLRPAMNDLAVRRVIQHQRNGFIFQTRSVKLPALKVIADPQAPALYASETRAPIETQSFDFLMVLRKHLTSAELVSFNKPLSERIVELVFKTAVPSKELETMSLVLELLPNASNIILLDAERRILSSFLPITPQHGITEYEKYSYHKSGKKADLEEVLESGAGLNESAESLVAKVAGLGPVFAGELVYRQRKTGRPVLHLLRAMLDQVRAPSRAAWLYTELPLGHLLEQNDLRRLHRAILSPIELESLARTYSSRIFANILEAAKFYFDELENRTLLEQAKLPVLRDMRHVTKRLADREKRLVREQTKYEESEGLQKTAQMLTSSGKKMDEHYDSVVVTDYFGEKPKTVDVQLDPSISLRENIEKMFKRHQKAGRGKTIVAQQLEQIRHRMALMEEQTRRLQAIKDWDTWLAIASKIPAGRDPHPAADSFGFALSGSRFAGGGRSLPGGEGRRVRAVNIDGREVLIG